MADAVIRSLLHDPKYISDEDTQASEAITPGYLVERGGSNDIQAHSTAGGEGPRYFADLEHAEGGAIGDDYDSGDSVNVLRLQSGDKIHARIGSGSSEYNISQGEALESDGTGVLQSHGTASTGTEDNKIAYADEAINNSGGSSEAVIKVTIA